jgi:hypothetical protein
MAIQRFDYTHILRRKVHEMIKDLAQLDHPQARRTIIELKLLLNTLTEKSVTYEMGKDLSRRDSA